MRKKPDRAEEINGRTDYKDGVLRGDAEIIY